MSCLAKLAGMGYDDRHEKHLVDKISDKSWLDRVPLLPMPVIMILGAVMGINGALNLFTDYDSPWWVGWALLIAFFLLLFRAARAEKIAKAADKRD